MFRSLRSHVTCPFIALFLLAVLTDATLIAQRQSAAPARDRQEATTAESPRTNGVVHSLNGAQGDVTLQGEGGLVVSQQGNTIVVSAPTTLGVGRSEPDPKYALDVGGTGVVRIGNSIFLDGVTNTVSTSTGELNFSSSNITTSGVISGDGSGLTKVSFGSLLGGVNEAQFIAPNAANMFSGIFTGAFTGNLTGNATSATTANTATTATTAATANNLAGGTFNNLYHFTNSGNTYRGAFTGDGSGLTGITTSGLATGSYGNAYQFTNNANSFAGTFTGTLNGAASSATTANTASKLAAGNHTDLYHFTNTGNTYQGTFLGTFSGNATSATTATTANTANTLAAGEHAAAYQFTNPSNTFAGAFTGNLNGNATSATTADTATNAANATNAATAATATTLAGGAHGNQYSFTNSSNAFTGTFTGDGSGLTGVSTSGLATGTYANAYQFTNAANTFTGSFTGNLTGTASSATSAATATTAETATTLAEGTHTASYTFNNLGNQFSGTFAGDGSQLTGIADESRVSKAGDTMSGLLTLSESGLQFADGTTMTTSATPQGWSLGGNAGLTQDQFLGTTDLTPLQFRVANVNALRIVPPPSALVISHDAPNIIAGGPLNEIVSTYVGSVISGGGPSIEPNQVAGNFATIAGGTANLVGSDYSVVSGGSHNRAGLDFTFTSTQEAYATVSGGYENHAAGLLSAIAGGYSNEAAGMAAFVAGYNNQAGGEKAAVGGGEDNSAFGDLSFVAGGSNNLAVGANSFVAGNQATAMNDHAFVFNDGTAPLQSEHDHQFLARATGGFKFLTNAADVSVAVGAVLNPGSGSWSSASDRNAKKNLESVDAESVLRAVARMPIWRWSYKTQPDNVRHMGPTSQDFRAAFGLGENDTTISVVDSDGVSLAAIQALEKRTEQLQQENARLRSELESMRATQQQMLYRVEDLLRQRK